MTVRKVQPYLRGCSYVEPYRSSPSTTDVPRWLRRFIRHEPAPPPVVTLQVHAVRPRDFGVVVASVDAEGPVTIRLNGTVTPADVARMPGNNGYTYIHVFSVVLAGTDGTVTIEYPHSSWRSAQVQIMDRAAVANLPEEAA